MASRHFFRSFVPVGVLLVLLAGCSKIEELREEYEPDTPRERYELGLQTSGLIDSELGSAWERAGQLALDNPVRPSGGHAERGIVDAQSPGAAAYEIELARGERLQAEVQFVGPGSGKIFLDLFANMEAQGLGYRRIALSDSLNMLLFNAIRGGTYILRLQPELLARGEYELRYQKTASVVFPVSGKDSGAIQSRFGAPRDGGRRQHHGVDIFAPRRTPVVAAVDGVVSRVRNGGLGGKTVWLRQSRTGYNFYYAHLDEQLVESGQRVVAGDTLGLVGNTGNARTTPPHLHFGIYSNGPMDPYPFVHETDPPRMRIVAREEFLGQRMRTNTYDAELRAAPSRRGETRSRLARSTSVQVLAASGSYYLVGLPDGTRGFIDSSALEPLTRPLEQRVLASAQVLRNQPRIDSEAVGSESAGSTVSVNGRFGSYVHVSTEDGEQGWLGDS